MKFIQRGAIAQGDLTQSLSRPAVSVHNRNLFSRHRYRHHCTLVCSQHPLKDQETTADKYRRWPNVKILIWALLECSERLRNCGDSVLVLLTGRKIVILYISMTVQMGNL